MYKLKNTHEGAREESGNLRCVLVVRDAYASRRFNTLTISWVSRERQAQYGSNIIVWSVRFITFAGKLIKVSYFN